MADVHGKATRSCNMSRIRGKDTKSEMPVCLMPAASHVYKNIDRQREFDSGRSRMFCRLALFLYTYNTSGIVRSSKKCRFCRVKIITINSKV
ncbi:hypothetical protein GM418_05865 [Maribellus comscasis]|uniref:Uncharacterized protein n=1 Tax=Maribellus comscasis TaxID=2681766 RepID=A0A6I6JSS1_9BACT|nr:hypothetical protein GM418_05865 [Maribellus comscasis]